MTLTLEATVLPGVHAHASETYPRECCGILLGEKTGDGWRATRVVRAGNLAPEGSPDRYVMDPKDRLVAEALAKAAGLVVVGFYHSHPDHDVYFSRTDLENAEEFLLGEPWLPPAYAYLVVSSRAGKPAGHGAFVVRDGASVPIDTRLES